MAQWTIRYGSDRLLGKKDDSASPQTAANKKLSQPA
jgi:hypothetical protein